MLNATLPARCQSACPPPAGRVGRCLLFLSGWLALTVAGVVAAEIETESPLPAEQAASMTAVPEGFQVQLFAAEPDVQQPIGFCIDDRGRLWVAEAYNYPHHGTKPGDRIVILEDTDGDGRADQRTVFYDQLNYVTGIEVGFGGAWVMSPPYFYFIPDANGDDVPDREPQVLLDGFGNHANSHNLANGFAWGPDGWLYGTHGRTNWSKIGKPGTPEAERQVFDGGVYRYHPIRHVWEPFADGTTNPWGIDWNDYGQAFVCNCVNPHLFHVIQGAHYEPWRNRESSRYAYQRIDTIADHLHFVGTQNVRDGLGSTAEDLAGGGHAHCGTMIYLGDNWPQAYRNHVFMHNIHGKRINQDFLRRQGSGYVASHGPDLMRSADPWYMGVTLQYGPDGAVYSSDWSDTGECHSVKNTRRETGRIFKISYGQPRQEALKLSELTDDELVELQLHRNDWYVRHARRLLQERLAAGGDLSAAHRRLLGIYQEHEEVPRKLRALWALHATGGIDADFLATQLAHPNEYVRAWVIQLLCERPERLTPAMLRSLATLAESEPAALVRLALTSALQRLPLAERWPIVTPLALRGEDAEDANLPLMIWYAVEPLYNADPTAFIRLGEQTRIPLVRRHIARRVAEGGTPGTVEAVVRVLAAAEGPETQNEWLAGLLTGFEGRRTVPRPDAWADAYPRLRRVAAVRPAATRLALVFDDPAAVEALRESASDVALDADARTLAVQTLVAKKPPRFAEVLLAWLDDPAIRNAAIRGLAEYDHAETAAALLGRYRDFDPATRQDALQTLASRKAWASRLLDAVEADAIPRTELTAFTARQLQNLGDPSLSERVVSLWGQVRSTPQDKLDAIARYQKAITPEKLAVADRTAGRALFEARCANCHKLFGHGSDIGPELTGSQRTQLVYLLENLLDPSASVAKDYQMQVIRTDSGRVITGLLVAQSDQALTIQTTNERVVVPADEIESQSTSPLSVMPEGLLEQLSIRQVVELIAYLGGPAQVPLPGN
jgi:putative membrane-bound dehydrogenase-like protein